jgi:hypothetical protein
MQTMDAQTTNRSSRLKRLITLYETGQASDFMDRVLDKVFAQEAAEEAALINQLRGDLNEFEERYEMDSQTFYKKFKSGELGDAMDYMEWAALFNMFERAKARLEILTS